MTALSFEAALAEIQKDSPSVGDVHVASAGGTPPKKKKPEAAEKGAPGLPHPHIGSPKGTRPKRPTGRTFTVQPNDANPLRSRATRAPTGWARKSDDEIRKLAEELAVLLAGAEACEDYEGLSKSTFDPETGAFEFTVPISKTQEDQNLVFGWASVIEENGAAVFDSQGDRISEGVLEKAFYGFAEDARVAGEMHRDYGPGFGKMVECMVFTKEKQRALGINLGKVGAWVGFRVAPDLFKKVKSGEYRAFSFGGRGRRLPAS